MTSVGPGQFATTRWTLVSAAGGPQTPASREALAELCAAYWYPLYALVRRSGHQPAAAQDLTQEFFAELLEKERLQAVDPTRGRFRAFLRTALQNFLANQHRRERAAKRGGGRALWSLDFEQGELRFSHEPVDPWTPERHFEREWAQELLQRSLQRLRDEYHAAGKGELLTCLTPYLGGESGRSYAEIAEGLGMTAGAVKVAVHRLRQRCRELLRDEVAQTVQNEEELEAELQTLFQAVEAP